MRRSIDQLSAGPEFRWQFNGPPIWIRVRSSRTTQGCDLNILGSSGGLVWDGWQFLLQVSLFKPRSVGQVSLRSANPEDPPLIDVKYFSDPDGHDAAVLAEGVAVARRLAETAPLRDWLAFERWPGNQVVGSELLAFARANGYTYFHPAGTCKMGPDSDPLAVVDRTCKVRGLDRLHVADASIMPTLPAAMTNLTCMAIGERLSELLS
jgi:choline dehydrogenase